MLVYVFPLQAQIVGLAIQIAWTANVELALTEARGQDTTPLQKVMGIIESTLNVLADCVLLEQPFIRRKKLEYLVSVPKSHSICMCCFTSRWVVLAWSVCLCTCLCSLDH